MVRTKKVQVMEMKVLAEGGRVVKFRWKFKEVSAEGTENRPKRVKLTEFFKPPINEVQHRRIAALRFLHSATHYLEVRDSCKYKTLSKNHREWHNLEFNNYLDELLKS